MFEGPFPAGLDLAATSRVRVESGRCGHACTSRTATRPARS
jgi:hypothetical protein